MTLPAATDGEVVLRPAVAADLPHLAALPGLSASTRRGLDRELSRAASDVHGDTVVLVATARATTTATARSTDTATARATTDRAMTTGTDSGTDTAAARVTATGDREVVGAAFGLVQVDDGHVVDLAVAPARHRSGIGRALLSALTEELRTRGARAVTLEVRAGNHAALALYREEGFVVEGRRGGYYPDGEDALLLWQHAGPGRVDDGVTTTATRGG